MKRILILLMLPLLFAPVGYYVGLRLVGEPAPAADENAIEAAETVLYKMPLGGLTIQVLQSKSILHVVMDLDVFLEGASEFERLSGAEGRAMLRDATITAISDLAETTLWVQEGQEKTITDEALAKQIAFKLYRKFDAVRATRINRLLVLRSNRG